MFEMTTSDSVATIVLAHPPVNAIGQAWLDGLEALLDKISQSTNVNVIHIRSSQKVFCAGADLKEMRGRFESPDGPDQMYSGVAKIQRLFARLEALPQVSIAEIGGPAMGGGFELALSCDLRIAANEAKMGLPEARLGLIPGAGGTQRLTRLCGRAVASRIILGAELVDGAEACKLGMVQWSVPQAELAEYAAATARRIAQLPVGALGESKSLIAAAATPGNGGFSAELESTRRLLLTADTKQRVAAFFAAKK